MVEALADGFLENHLIKLAGNGFERAEFGISGHDVSPLVFCSPSKKAGEDTGAREAWLPNLGWMFL